MTSLNNQRVGAAREYAASLPEGPLRVSAMNTLISEYRFDDPVSVIDSFSAGPSRDVAYAAHIRKSTQKGKAAPDIEQIARS
jgi:hypothetical protein